MKHPSRVRLAAMLALVMSAASLASAQIGRRFPSERKIVPDPVTGVPLSFLTSGPGADSKIYQTHNQWTADGKWLIFRSQRAPGQALAVNEESGAIVQVTEGGYMGMLCIARQSMKLFLMRPEGGMAARGASLAPTPSTNTPDTPPEARPRGGNRPRSPIQVVEVDLARVFADSEAGAMKPAADYERVCGTIAPEMMAGGDMAIDANEGIAYFRIGGDEARKKLPPDAKVAERFGPRGMGAGPAALASMDLKTGEVKVVAAVPFQIGHVQTNPFVPGEIVFCWETGGKAPQRTWTVMADGSGLRPLYPEAPHEWVTHEAVITKDEVAIALMGHRRPGVNDDWGISGTREHPTGLAIVNLRTREMRIAGQTPSGSGLWHVHGSADGRWAVGDDFSRSIYLIDRQTGEMMTLSTGHKPGAADHPHPTFSADSTRIQIQSAMLSADGRSMNICVIPVPDSWLKRSYPPKAVAPTR
ncbi:MAG TPA: hypothetical protein VM029_19455 [Opitutaceae bacterium]|nr:hypothetical protein [Opitutaceae bacterium]